MPSRHERHCCDVPPDILDSNGSDSYLPIIVHFRKGLLELTLIHLAGDRDLGGDDPVRAIDYLYIFDTHLGCFGLDSVCGITRGRASKENSTSDNRCNQNKRYADHSIVSFHQFDSLLSMIKI